jgi:vitamin B12 transporter
MNKKVFLAVTLGLLSSRGVFAEESAPVYTMDEVVVTSSRFEELKKNITSNLTIISREEIELSSAKDLSELLAEQSLGHFQKYPGTLTAIGIRGFRSETHGNDLMGKVLILLDGRRAGTGNLAKIMTDNVERIEIIRGPASVQYGSAAIGGVVNVITKTGRGGPSFFAAQQVGNNEYSKTSAGMEGIIGKVDFSGSVSTADMGDYQTGSGGTYQNTGFDDQVTGSLNVGYEFLPHHRLQVIHHVFDLDRAGSPSYFSSPDLEAYTVQNNHSTDFMYEGSVSEGRWSWMARYYTGMDKYSYVSPGSSYMSQSDTDQQGAQAQISYAQSSLRVTAGVDWLQYELESTLVPKWSQYENPAGFILGRYLLFDDALTLTAGLRYDDYSVDLHENEGTSRSTNNTSGQAGLALRIADGFRLRGSYAEGFRMPSAREFAGEIVSYEKTYTGNAELNPESSQTWEGGFDMAWKSLAASCTVFTTDYTDLIETSSTGSSSYTYVNVGSATVSGLEAELSWPVAPWGESWIVEPFAGYTYLFEFKDNKTGANLPFTPEWNASTGIRLREKGGFAGTVNVAMTGNTIVQDWENNNGAFLTKGSFAVVNLTASKKFPFNRTNVMGRGITLKGEVNNLFDRDYQYVTGYPMPGINFLVGLRVDI